MNLGDFDQFNTLFRVFFAFFWKKYSKNPLCINIFSKNEKNEKTFTLVLACCPSLKITNLPDFRWNFQNFVTDSIPKERFYFFSQKKYILIALHFWQNHQILTKFPVFFQKLRKSCCFWENRKLSVFLFWEIRQIHGFWAFQTVEICHRFPPFPFSIATYCFFSSFPFRIVFFK